MKVMTTETIKRRIENNYQATVEDIELVGDYVTLKCVAHNRSYPFIALNLLNYFPQLRVVHFTGGWIEGVYTRNTLSYCGYKVKENKTK